MSKPIIYIYDTTAAGGVDFDEVGQISSYTDLDFTPAWNSQGSFTIKINKNNLGAEYLAADRVVYLDADRVGYIDSVQAQQKKDKSGEFIIASGTELKDQLLRITLPPSGSDTDSYTSEAVETIVKSLIRKNVGATAAAVRQINGLVIATDQSRGSTIDFSTRHKKLLDEIYSLLQINKMGLEAIYDPDVGTITYDVVEGVDRTEGQSANNQIILSTDWKTALEYDYKKDQDRKSVV